MDERLFHMLCAAVDEEFDKKLFKIGPAGRAFREYWRGIRTEQQCEASGIPGPHATPDTADTGDKPDETAKALRRENAALREALEAARQEAQQLAERARECRQRLDAAQQAQTAAEERAEQARAQLEAARQASLPEQRQLEEVHAFLRDLPQDVARLLAPYYALDSLLVFLVGCGQFSRLSQCWDACGKAVAGGAPGEALSACLRRLLALYNLSSADTPATAVEPQPGDRYDYESAQRIGSDGGTVRALLLPGLRNAGGKVLHKALVRLG